MFTLHALERANGLAHLQATGSKPQIRTKAHEPQTGVMQVNREVGGERSTVPSHEGQNAQEGGGGKVRARGKTEEKAGAELRSRIAKR